MADLGVLYLVLSPSADGREAMEGFEGGGAVTGTDVNFEAIHSGFRKENGLEVCQSR